MLNVSRDLIQGAAKFPGRERIDDRRTPGLGQLIAAIRRRKVTSLGTVLACLLLGWWFVVTSTPLYTATSEVLIDGRRSHANDGTSNRSLAELGMDSASIESQVTIIGSERNAIETIKTLRLDQGSELTSPTTAFAAVAQAFKRLWMTNSGKERFSTDVPTEMLEGFMKRLDVKRNQQSYVISISFSATNRDLAALISNTIANTYVRAQVQGVLDTRVQAAGWLKDRLIGLRADLVAAEQTLRTARLEAGSTPSKDASTDQTRVLERALDDKRALYAALVDRSSAILQQQSLPMSDAVVSKTARAPERRSQPNVLLITLLSLVGGIAAACGLTVWREMTDKSFRTPGQLRDDLGLRLLANIPPVAAHDLRHSDKSTAAQMRKTVDTIQTMSHDALRIVGIASSIDGENSSFVARSLATGAAASGYRTLLITMDASASANRAAAIDKTPGFDAMSLNITGSRQEESAFGRAGLEAIETEIGAHYDLFVLDLPPLCALRDNTVATCIDTLVLVIAWGRTERTIVSEALHAVPVLAHRTAGVVFTEANSKNLQRYAREPVDHFHVACAHRADI